jgi:hypothetical protein
MRQATLKLKMYAKNVNIIDNNIEAQKMILSTMFYILGGLALVYVLILGNTVVNIVQRRALEKQELTLSNEVSSMELSYLSLTSSVDLALSTSMGFKQTKATFATRRSLGSLKLANNEI